MTNPNHNWDEQRLAELLRSAQHPAVPPDERFLAAPRRIDRGVPILESQPHA